MQVTALHLPASKVKMRLRILLSTVCFAAVLAALPGAASAQSFDNSGDNTVFGDYFVREVLLSNVDQNNSAVGRAISIIGVMTCDGQGDYVFTGQMMDTKVGSVQSYTTSGLYAVAENGFAVFQDLIDTSQYDFGATGVLGPAAILASATEGPQKNLFVAIPAGSSVGNSALQGSYTAGFIDFLGGSASKVRDGYFSMSTSGNGSFGNITVFGAMANQGSVDTSQDLTGVTYNITDTEGAGTINFPVSSTPSSALVSGQKSLFFSADGSLLLAGDPGGFDIMFGVAANSGPVDNGIYEGTFYLGGLENDASNLGQGQNGIDAFSGSIFALGQGTAISHLRISYYNATAIDYTYENQPYDVASDGSFTDGSLQGFLLADGGAILEVGTGSFYSLTPGLWAGEYSGPTVLLDPLKVWNAASFAPITNAVAPGEFVSLFGSGLANGVAQATTLPLPTTLGNVQVLVNGVLAPIQYVSNNQINILVPYSTTGGYAEFQVSNNGNVSDPVTLYQAPTAPGVFTSTNGGFAPGVGPGAVLHANSSAVTEGNPAKIGEQVELFMTGLGSVTPAVADGAAAPSNPVATVDADVGVFVDGVSAVVKFKGLSPGLAGLYQVNFVVPDGVSSGLVYLSVGTPDGQTVQAKLYVQ